MLNPTSMIVSSEFESIGLGQANLQVENTQQKNKIN
jgi:hypothetical protein